MQIKASEAHCSTNNDCSSFYELMTFVNFINSVTIVRHKFTTHHTSLRVVLRSVKVNVSLAAGVWPGLLLA